MDIETVIQTLWHHRNLIIALASIYFLFRGFKAALDAYIQKQTLDQRRSDAQGEDFITIQQLREEIALIKEEEIALIKDASKPKVSVVSPDETSKPKVSVVSPGEASDIRSTRNARAERDQRNFEFVLNAVNEELKLGDYSMDRTISLEFPPWWSRRMSSKVFEDLREALMDAGWKDARWELSENNSDTILHLTK